MPERGNFEQYFLYRHKVCYNFHMNALSSFLDPRRFLLFLGALLLPWLPHNAAAQDPSIWIANRSDGKTGSGTAPDPFDGSDADRLVSIIASAAPNTTINVGAGTFPIHFVNLTSGIKLLGAGKNKTILAWDGTGNPYTTVINVVGDNVRVSDLTINCQADVHAFTPNALQSFDASGVTFSRVRATNMRADADSPWIEWFPIAQFAQTAVETDGLIDDCEVDNFSGYGTMINLLHGGGGVASAYMSGVISNNYVHNCTANGIGLSGAGDALVTNNTVDGTNLGIIHDTWFSPNVQISDNKLINLHQYGILWHSDNNGVEVAGNGSSDASILNNTVNITGERNDTVGILVSGVHVTGTRISGNMVTTTNPPTPWMLSYQIGYSDGTEMTENRATNDLTPFYYQQGSDPLGVRENRYLSDALMPVPLTAIQLAQQNALINVSTRAVVSEGDNVMIGGFIITGDTPKKVVLRAIGPSLTSAGVTGALADPILEMHAADGTLIASNDNWKTHLTSVNATGLSPVEDQESAIVADLEPGSYTAVVRSLDGSAGVALVELYDLNPSNSTIANISTRARVDGAGNSLIGGFIIGDNSSAKLLVRALGPSLADSQVADALPDPMLSLYNSDGSLLYQNDDWRSQQEAEIADSELAPSKDREAAIIATLPAGNYTAVVTGAQATSGVALVEVYNLSK